MLQKADVASVLAAENGRGRTRRWVLIGAGLVLAVAVGIGAWFWLSPALRSPADGLTTEKLERGDIHVTLTATGTLQPLHEAVVASLTPGTIIEVEADYNQTVVKGQPLARLDMRDTDARLQRSLAMVDVQRANRIAAEAAVTDAVAALARLQQLESSQSVSAKEIELAESVLRRTQANLEAARAQVKAAEADLQSVKVDYSKGTIVAPIDGMVLDVTAEVGTTIGAASILAPLFTIGSDLHQLDLEIDVDQADVPSVTADRRARFSVEAAPDKSLEGVIRQVRSAPSVSEGVVSYTAVISVDNPDLALRPGMTATAEIDVADALGVLTVPNAALRYHPTGAASPAGPGQHVYVLDQDTVREVAIETGLTDGQRTEVKSGDLKEGDLIVTGKKEH